MWKRRQAKDYFENEKVNDTNRDCISRETIKELLNRLALAETWLFRYLLGEDHVVQAAAVNVKVNERSADQREEPKPLFGDLYVIQNLKSGRVSFKLYSPAENRFSWTVDNISNLNGYVDLKCNTHILHLGDSVYTFKFPNKKERTLFRDNLNKFLFFEKSDKKLMNYKDF